MWKHLIGNYEISNSGEMRNTKTGKLLKPKVTKKGYLQYGISIDGKYKDVSVHRTVAQNFVENPNNKEQVNHIDGNKQNNHFSNLEWVSPSENINHAHQTGLSTSEHLRKSVKQLSKAGEFINSYESTLLAASMTNSCASHISSCCNGKRKTHNGFRWEYTT